jgi:hypothetical protein
MVYIVKCPVVRSATHIKKAGPENIPRASVPMKSGLSPYP